MNFIKKWLHDRKERKETEAATLEYEKKSKIRASQRKVEKSIVSMKNNITSLENLAHEKAVEAAKAKKAGNTSAYKVARSAIKIAKTKSAVLTTMVGQIETNYEMAKINNSVKDFVESMNIISQNLKETVPSYDLASAAVAYNQAIAANENQYDALDAFMGSITDGLEDFSGTDGVTDSEIDSLIDTVAEETDDDISLTEEQDERLRKINEKIGSSN